MHDAAGHFQVLRQQGLAHVLDAVVACAVDFDHVETVAAGDLAAVIAHSAWRNRRGFDAI